MKAFSYVRNMWFGNERNIYVCVCVCVCVSAKLIKKKGIHNNSFEI